MTPHPVISNNHPISGPYIEFYSFFEWKFYEWACKKYIKKYLSFRC
jgi:hypothetical protein